MQHTWLCGTVGRLGEEGHPLLWHWHAAELPSAALVVAWPEASAAHCFSTPKPPLSPTPQDIKHIALHRLFHT